MLYWIELHVSFCIIVILYHFVLHVQSDVVSGIPMETLLSAILEALAQPTVSYIGLSYNTTTDINTG